MAAFGMGAPPLKEVVAVRTMSNTDRVVEVRLPLTLYRRTSISGTKKAQITFPLRHFSPLKVVK
jgi:hypothetical protein